MLTDESSPVEKIVPNLCGMKASFEQYSKKRELWLQHNEGQLFAKPVFWPWIRDKS